MHDTSRHSQVIASKPVASRGAAWTLTGLTVAVAACAVGAGQVESPVMVWTALGLAFWAGRIVGGAQRRKGALHEISFAPSPSGAETRGPVPVPPPGPRTPGASK